VLSRGSVDILVNNAGYSQRAGFSDLGEGGVRDMFEVNFFAGVDIMGMCLPGMREGKGAVVWVSSVQGLLPLPGRSGYSASKHAVNGFAGSVRAELEGEVDVVVVNPGYVRTNLSVNAVGEVRMGKIR
jgi:short-subunit dehydrogenase